MENDKQQKTINVYEQEMKSISENPELTPFWKPTAGRYKLRITSEARFLKQVWNGEEKEFVKIEIIVGDKRFCWSFNRAKSKKSAWYQLCKIANDNNGKLENVACDVIVVGEGKNRQYTVFQ